MNVDSMSIPLSFLTGKVLSLQKSSIIIYYITFSKDLSHAILVVIRRFLHIGYNYMR